MLAAYAFGMLAPTAAFARADHDSIVHVLTESHGGMLILHFHENDGDHKFPAKPGSHPAHHCCGVVSLPGLEPSASISILPPQQAATLIPVTERLLAGCGSARLERPPKNSLTE